MKKIAWGLALVWFVAAMSSAQAAIAPINTGSDKYAALVVDADTGEVFHARNADKKRYPASLTKMMTLYMLFEALNAGDLSLETRLPVSEHAASQPQTNIGLKTGQTIKVRDAIKALIVRSANDVAVVVAEKLGKTEWNFARLMTEKARSLGMRRTQFRNAHGLPDRQQYTTARDMSRLAIALRRDFPQYYGYFTTKTFSWDGRSYTSHNRVLDRFDGVDGIKTGYIRMSGFNLASSVKRDGYHVVAVVMGGQTGSSRDDHMVSLLDQTFTVIAERGDEPRDFATAPIPQPKPALQRLASAQELPWRRAAGQEALQPEGQGDAGAAGDTGKTVKLASSAQAQSEPSLKPKPQPGRTESKDSDDKPWFRFISEPSQQQLLQQNTLDFQLASLQKQPDIQEKWAIQVGAFRDARAAMRAALKATSVAGDDLRDSRIRITDHGAAKASIHRARLANLTEHQARRACRTLSRHNTPCFVFRLDERLNL